MGTLIGASLGAAGIIITGRGWKGRGFFGLVLAVWASLRHHVARTKETNMMPHLMPALLAGCLSLFVTIENMQWQSSGNILAVFVTVENTGASHVRSAYISCYALDGEVPVAEGWGTATQIAPGSKVRATARFAGPFEANRIECRAERML